MTKIGSEGGREGKNPFLIGCRSLGIGYSITLQSTWMQASNFGFNYPRDFNSLTAINNGTYVNELIMQILLKKGMESFPSLSKRSLSTAFDELWKDLDYSTAKIGILSQLFKRILISDSISGSRDQKIPHSMQQISLFGGSPVWR